MWIRSEIVTQVQEVARIFYVDVGMATKWNEQRKEGELRMMTGWCWSAKKGGRERTGIKSITTAYIDAYYALVVEAAPPRITIPRLRVAADNTATRQRRVA
jgi:hypothetical protein